MAEPTRLYRGQSYTFRFEDLEGIFATTESALRARLLAAYSFVDNISVSRGLFSSIYAIQFTWNGPDGYSAGAAIGAMQEILASEGLAFVGAESGRVGEPLDLATPVARVPELLSTVSDAVKKVLDPNGVPSLKELLLGAGVLVVGGLVVYALVSGRNVREIVRSTKTKLVGGK